jgi:xanthine dehydrogenase accessory factor
MWLNSLNEWTREGIPCAIVTIIAATGSTPRAVGSKMVVNAAGKIAGSVGGGGVEHKCREEARLALAQSICVTKTYSLREGDLVLEGDQKSLGVCGGTVTVFIEPVTPPSEIVIFGAGHIGERLGRLCAVLDLPYRVYDNRAEYASPERFPDARERIVAPFGDLKRRIALTPRSYCVILTYGHAHDQECLECLLENRDLPYIGMIGSATKIAVLFKQLKGKGLNVDQRVYAPVGLRLGTQLPGEIALSILAEIYLLMNGGKLEHFRLPVDTEAGKGS